MIRIAVFIAFFSIAVMPALSAETGKDQSQVQPDQAAPPVPDQNGQPQSDQMGNGQQQQDQQGEDLTSPDDNNGDANGNDDTEGSPDEMSLGEIPAIQTVELTPDMAKRAVDAFVLVRDKYKDSYSLTDERSPADAERRFVVDQVRAVRT